MSKVYLFVRVNVKTGKLFDFLPLLEKHAAGIRNEDGCEKLEIFRDKQAVDDICVWEIWRDRAAWDAHMVNDASQAWRPAAAPYVERESITILDAV